MKNNKIKSRFVSFIIIALTFSCINMTPVFSHGTSYTIIKKGIVGVKASYHHGEPVKNSKAKIYRPGQSKPAAIKYTDADGVVFFQPDQAGTWNVHIVDDHGHGVRVPVVINTANQVSSGASVSTNFTLTQKIIMILSILWGGFGTVLFFAGKKKIQ